MIIIIEVKGYLATRYKHKGRKLFIFFPLSFIYILFCKRCPLTQNLMSSILNVSNSCTVYPSSITQIFFVKYDHVPYT
ncbi:hypothetical protein Hanom_Chr11g01049131 [Helianthus anomalus]